MANKNLGAARKAKNDEFYTQFQDIQREVEAYVEYDKDTFRGKVVYCNCDDPFESNFFRYFVLNFKRLGLKSLVTTSYKPSPVANTQLGLFGDDKTLQPDKGRPKITANKFVINEVGDINGDGSFSLQDIAEQLKSNKHNEWEPLKGGGDFRSEECVQLLKQSDIVVTNPPFSLFREYIGQLVEYRKDFLIIGTLNAITYKEVFPLLKANKVWLGNNARVNGGAMFYEIPKAIANPDQIREIRTSPEGREMYITRVQGVRWFTTLEHGRLHQPISLMTMSDNRKYNKKVQKSSAFYSPYDNYDAIEIPNVDAIPSDYHGVMGVPISFFDKYSPDQFEVLGTSDNGVIDDEYKLTPGLRKEFVDDYYKAGGTGSYKEGNPTAGFYEDGIAKMSYKRIFIRHKKVAS